MYLSLVIGFAYIFFSVIMIIPFYYDYKEGDTEDFIIIGTFLGICVIYGFILFKEAIKQRKVRNFKHNGGGILKKAKVTNIKKLKANKGRGYSVDVYYFEAEDGGMTYYSNGNTKGALLGTSIEELKLLYAKYGYTYDEKQTQKEDLLRRLDELIAEKEYEIQNSWFISKITKAKKSAELQVDKTTISLGYIEPYWQINDKKVTVGDIVDVYVDPSDPEKYWIDMDFLF